MKLCGILAHPSAGFRISIILLLVISPSWLRLSSQERQRPKPVEELGNTLLERSAAATAQSSGVALESTVDPEKYFVGPSDVIAVNIWMSPPLNLSLTVTPEGTLIIPTVGEVMVADLTLAEAKAKILREARKKYLSVEITATLVKPRPIIVSVTGHVLNAGLYTLSAVDRAHRAIEEANKLSRTQFPEDLDPYSKEMSTRNIVLKHKDGSQDRVDIPKYFATHEDRWNPYLREGDIIVVPKKSRMKNVFAVYGQVNVPGRFEFVDGDSVLDAIRIVHGTTRLALADQTLFSRLNEDGSILSTRTINIPAIMEGREANIALEPGDRIIVRGKNDLREDYNVDLKGEVVYPGTYPITKNRTHLSEVVRQAGGFTDFAALTSAQVSHRSEEEMRNAEGDQALSMRGGVATQDSAGFALETDLRLRRQAVTVDLARLFLQNDSTQDIILQAEDEIIIPRRQQTIYVFGQVAEPGHIPYAQGKEPKYYVSRAGGFTGRANTGHLTIIKAKTKQWLSPDDTKLEEGDYIWVPTDPDRPFSYYMTIASQAATVLSVIIGVAVVISQVTK
ncbi:MAG: SLBB domain-containing protein [Ignavibacteria bacterium]|nr:SLBB domain-containing protein [Ignavibacteria bacterium]